MSDGISVLLPYKDLQSLLVASEKLSGLEKKVARLSEQYAALYGSQRFRMSFRVNVVRQCTF